MECTFECYNLKCDSPTYKRPKILYTAVAFLMNRSYRAPHKYALGVIQVANDIKKYGGSDPLMRIYIDDSIPTSHIWKESLDKLMAMSHVQIIKFTCPKHRDPPTHDGTFGTLIRFLPITDHPLIPEHLGPIPPGTIVTSIDIDEGFNIRSYRHFLHFLTQWEAQASPKLKTLSEFAIAMPSTLARHLSPLAIWAQFCAFRDTRIPHQLLDNFLNKGHYFRKEFQRIQDEATPYYTEIKSDKIESTSEFKYGIDEYFINHVWLPYRKVLSLTLPPRQYWLVDWTKELLRDNIRALKQSLTEDNPQALSITHRYLQTLNPALQNPIPKLPPKTLSSEEMVEWIQNNYKYIHYNTTFYFFNMEVKFRSASERPNPEHQTRYYNALDIILGAYYSGYLRLLPEHLKSLLWVKQNPVPLGQFYLQMYLTH